MLRVRLRALPEPVQVVVPDTFKYGLMYNWHAATDARLITSSGWILPTAANFVTLINYAKQGLDFDTGANALKQTGTEYWQNNNGLNTFLFNSRGGGQRSPNGSFTNLKIANVCHSNDNYSGFNLYGLYILNNHSFNTSMQFSPAGDDVSYKKLGTSIRLLKTTTTLTHGQSGTYIGNDGKAYRTICIGTQEWLADSLAETKFRNGDWIPGFDGGVYTPFTNAAWAAFTTAGCCAYNDDTSNI